MIHPSSNGNKGTINCTVNLVVELSGNPRWKMGEKKRTCNLSPMYTKSSSVAIRLAVKCSRWPAVHAMTHMSMVESKQLVRSMLTIKIDKTKSWPQPVRSMSPTGLTSPICANFQYAYLAAPLHGACQGDQFPYFNYLNQNLEAKDMNFESFKFFEVV
jgi:hypothetical protein